MAELLDNVQTEFAKPMFITWIIHSMYGVFLVPWVLLARSRVGGGHWRVGSCGGGSAAAAAGTDVAPQQQPCCGLRLRCSVGACLGYRRAFSHFVWTGGVMSLISAFGALTWYRSLPLTTVAANNTIYQSSCVFVFLLSVAFLGERVTWNKVLAVALSVAGVLLISLFPASVHASDVNPSALGYVWLLASTLCYAGIQVFYKKYGDDRAPQPPAGESGGDGGRGGGGAAAPLLESSGGGSGGGDGGGAGQWNAMMDVELSLLVIGVMGVFSLLLIPLAFPALQALGVESFEWPPRDVVGLLLLNAFLDALYNVLLLIALLITTPVFVSIGTMIVSPASMLTDWVVSGTPVTPGEAVGALFVLAGFFLLNDGTAELAARGLARCRVGGRKA